MVSFRVLSGRSDEGRRSDEPSGDASLPDRALRRNGDAPAPRRECRTALQGIATPMKRTVERRSFVKLCAAAAVTAGANPALLASTGTTARLYDRTALVDEDGTPITAQNLAVGHTYVFHYPYATTPCFLLDLGRPVDAASGLVTEAGEPYPWPGGAGTDRSIVAFAAICAHKMTHPAKDVSFIDYRHGKVRYRDADDTMREGRGVIYCCSEKSVYDPADGARVLGGPAKQPLATILLQSEPDSGALFALGTIGGEMYDTFFEKFAFRLALEHETDNIRRRSGSSALVMGIETYSRTTMQC